MAQQLDLDHAAALAPHAFECFASLVDPGWIGEALQPDTPQTAMNSRPTTASLAII